MTYLIDLMGNLTLFLMLLLTALIVSVGGGLVLVELAKTLWWSIGH